MQRPRLVFALGIVALCAIGYSIDPRADSQLPVWALAPLAVLLWPGFAVVAAVPFSVAMQFEGATVVIVSGIVWVVAGLGPGAVLRLARPKGSASVDKRTVDGSPANPLSALGYGIGLCVGACSVCFLALFAFTYFLLGFGDPLAEFARLFPGIVIAGLLGSFTFGWYRNRTTSKGQLAVYAGSVIGVIVLGVFGTIAFNWLVNQWR